MSNPFRFLMGPNKREFTIHSDLVAHQSDALRALVNGDFREATDRVVRWENVDEDIFLGFWQYVYTGDYDTVKPTIGPESRWEASPSPEPALPLGCHPPPPTPPFGSGLIPSPSPPPPQAPGFELTALYNYGPLPSTYFGTSYVLSSASPSSFPTPAVPVLGRASSSSIPQRALYVPASLLPLETRAEALADDPDSCNQIAGGRGQAQRRARDHHHHQASKQPTKQETQWNEFNNLSKPGSHPQVEFEAPTNKSANDDYTSVFLFHARLYIFAECYGIARLMELSFHKLHQMLVAFNLCKRSVGNIVALLRYCHEELVPKTLREMVVLYASCNVERLWMSEQFQELVEADGELLRALMRMMLKRLD